MATAMEKSALGKGSDFFDEDTPMCEPCSVKGNQLPADRFCSDCQEYLCRTCSTHHISQKALRSHVLLALEDVKKAPAKVQTDKCSMRCSEHRDKRIKYYCREHSSFGCSVCFTMGHKQCNTPVYIPKEAKEIKNQDEYKRFDQSLKSLETAYKARIDDVEKMLKQMEADESQLKEIFKDFRKRLNNALDQLEVDVTTKAVKIKNEEIKKLKSLSKELETSLGDVKALMKKTDDFLQTGKHCDVFVTVKQEESQLVKLDNDLEAIMSDKNCQRYNFRPNTDVLDAATLGSLEIRTDETLNKATETMTKIKPYHTRMLLALQYPIKMEEKYKELKVTFNENRNQLTFDGPRSNIKAAQLDMYEMINSFAEEVVKDIPEQSFNMYTVKEVKQYVQKKLQRRNLPVTWEVWNGELIVSSTSTHTLHAGMQIIRGAVRETRYPLGRATRYSVEASAWITMVQNLQARHSGKVMITRGSANDAVITTTADVEMEIVRAFKNFLRGSTNY